VRLNLRSLGGPNGIRTPVDDPAKPHILLLTWNEFARILPPTSKFGRNSR
jgi:hypothetical protein